MMYTISFVQGDATAPSGDGPMIITHISNDVGGRGRVSCSPSRRDGNPEAAYRQWYRERSSNDLDLGATQLVSTEPEFWVANIIGQHDIRAIDGESPVRYWAIEAGLADLADDADAMGADPKLSTLRKLTEALDGTLRIEVGVDGRTFQLSGASAMSYRRSLRWRASAQSAV